MENLFDKIYKQVNGIQESEAPVNVANTSDGNVASDTPVIKPRKFAGMPMFDVDPDKYCDCKAGKYRYHRYSKYVGNDDVGEAIRQYGRKNPNDPIIVRNSQTGAMMYLKQPKPSKLREEFEREAGDLLED